MGCDERAIVEEECTYPPATKCAHDLLVTLCFKVELSVPRVAWTVDERMELCIGTWLIDEHAHAGHANDLFPRQLVLEPSKQRVYE